MAAWGQMGHGRRAMAQGRRPADGRGREGIRQRHQAKVAGLGKMGRVGTIK